MSDQRKNRRKTMLVNPVMQKKLVVVMSLIPSLTLVATMVLIAYFCQRLYNEATKSDVHLDSLLPLFLATSGLVLVAACFMLSNALVISHRIFGPSYRLCKSVEQIRNGDLAFRIMLRKGDYLTELKDELNLLIDALNENPPIGFVTREIRAREEADAQADPAPRIEEVTVDDVPSPFESTIVKVSDGD